MPIIHSTVMECVHWARASEPQRTKAWFLSWGNHNLVWKQTQKQGILMVGTCKKAFCLENRKD